MYLNLDMYNNYQEAMLEYNNNNNNSQYNPSFPRFGEIQAWTVLPLQVSLLIKRLIQIDPQKHFEKTFCIWKIFETINNCQDSIARILEFNSSTSISSSANIQWSWKYDSSQYLSTKLGYTNSVKFDRPLVSFLIRNPFGIFIQFSSLLPKNEYPCTEPLPIFKVQFAKFYKRSCSPWLKFENMSRMLVLRCWT